MRVLITGAHGQLARELTRSSDESIQLLALGHRELDITDKRQLENRIAEHAPAVVINAAAYTDVDRAESEPKLAYAVNETGPRLLAELAGQLDFRLIHISTDYVFSGTATRPYRCSDRSRPVNVYGASKRAGEIAVLEHARDNSVVLRTSWLYSNNGKNFVLMMLDQMRRGEPVAVVNDQTGSPTWAASVANAIWRIVTVDSLSGIHHWTDGGRATWYEFAAAIADGGRSSGILSAPVSLQPIATSARPAAARRPAYSVLDCDETSRALGLRPTPWRVNLSRMLEMHCDA